MKDKKEAQPKEQAIASKIESQVAEDEAYEDLDKLRKEIQGKIDESKAYFEKNMHIGWDKANNLYRCIRARGQFQLEWQNNFASGKPFATVQQLYANLMSGLYPKDKLWSLRPAEVSQPNTNVADLWKKVMLIQAQDMHLRRNLGWSVLDAIICDYGILEYGWLFKKRVKKYLDYKSGKVTPVEDPERISRPYFESVSPFDFLSDLDAMSWETQEWAARRVRVTLGEMESDPTYNMNAEIERLKRNNKDATEYTAFDGWKYWTANTIIIILDGGHIIKKHWTLLKSNVIPCLPVTLFTEQRTPAGIGLLGVLRGSLEYIDKIMNSNADNMDLALQRIWTLKSSSDIPFSRLNIFPGKIFKVDSHDELAPVNMPGINLDSYKEMQIHEQFIKDISGNMEMYTGDTATQDKINAVQTTVKEREVIESNQEELLKPMLRAWIDMNQQFMDKKEVALVVGKQEASKYKVEDKGTDLNVALIVDVTGESSEVEKLIGIDNITRFTNLVSSIVQVPPNLQGPIFAELVELFGYKDKFKLETPNAQAKPISPDAISKIKQEAARLASAKGLTPEQYMGRLAEQYGMPGPKLMEKILNAGSIEEFLKAPQGGAV